MNITDETLSAFLDAELSEQEMQAVRELLQVDPEVTDRLAQLAIVDQQLVRHFSAVDAEPLPQAVTDLLAQAEHDEASDSSAAVKAGSVLPFRQPAQIKSRSRRYSGMAIAAALVMALGLSQLLGNNSDAQWQRVAGALESFPSGAALELEDGRLLTPRLTFENQQGDYCRQYHLQGAEQASENIACRAGGDWTLTASMEVVQTVSAAEYQTASGGYILDGELDQMMSDQALSSDQERLLIASGWMK
jgi:hypothetical protein